MPSSPELDVLAFAAHPDDVELSVGGTMCLLAKQGYKTGIVDFSQGELGTRGTPELRMQEAQHASEIMGLQVRRNLGIPDGGMANTREHQLRIIETVRAYRPHIVFVNAPEDRHPDHGDASRLTLASLFYAGLAKIQTTGEDGESQSPWRPNHVLHYMQTLPFEPTLVVDVSDVWEDRLRALQAFQSQFHNPEYEAGSSEPQTFISTPAFFEFIEARAKDYGHMIGAAYGEPFLYRNGPFGVTDVVSTFGMAKVHK